MARMQRLSSARVRRRGDLVATLLSAAVCRRVPDSIAARDLADVLPVLLRFGTGPLAWWALCNSSLAEDPSTIVLRDSYRLGAIRAALADAELERLFAHVTSAGLSPILGKGWSVSRSYPSAGLRSYCDFDLYVPRRDYPRLVEVLARREAGGTFAVDAHDGLSYLDDRDVDAVFARSVQIPLGSAIVRAFGAEDRLRLSCLHALAEGLSRPLWLCDIAFQVSAAANDFDWSHFSGGSRRRTEWCAAAIGLAHQKLGVDLSHLPADLRRPSLPRWFARSVLTAWGRGPSPRGSRIPMDQIVRTPGTLLRALLDRWPHPVEATVGLGGRINGVPRLPYKIGEAARRTLAYFGR
jgi:hypothetical protein